jgi:hypothetical protein
VAAYAAARVVVELADGRRFERSQTTIHGDPADPLTLEDIIGKYAGFARTLDRLAA